MRQRGSQCEVLIQNLDDLGYEIVLGDAFFQNFEALMSVKNDSLTMNLRMQKEN